VTERLDQHRGRGQQQITVKHVTVNADQAVVTDNIVSNHRKKTVTSSFDKIRAGSPPESPAPILRLPSPICTNDFIRSRATTHIKSNSRGNFVCCLFVVRSRRAAQSVNFIFRSLGPPQGQKSAGLDAPRVDLRLVLAWLRILLRLFLIALRRPLAIPPTIRVAC
jgi:hypothetical protein